MKLCEKIKDIKTRFGLSDEEMSNIFNTSKNRVLKIIKGEGKPTASELGNFSRTFSIPIEKLLDEEEITPLLTMKIFIDMSKYKNIFDAYVKVLREYYSTWDVYVLARIKEKTTFQKLYEIIFKEDISEQEDKPFTPNYLAIKNEKRLLINISNGLLEVTEVPICSREKRFTYKGYRYVRANKVSLYGFTGVQKYF